MSPDWRNNFITQNYARIEAVAPIADNGPALHLIMDTDTETSDDMAENWCVPEPRDTLGSDVEIIDVKNPATSVKPDAPKRRGNSLRRCFKNRKVARKIQLEKENIPASASLSIAPPVKPGADVGQFPLHTYTSPLQQRVLHRRNYDAEENQPQRANTAVRTTSLSPICVVDRDECYAAPKQPGNPSPKISHQKYTNVSREKRAALNARPRITRPANSTGVIPQVTPENREIEQLSEGPHCQILPPFLTLTNSPSHEYGNMLDLTFSRACSVDDFANFSLPLSDYNLLSFSDKNCQPAQDTSHLYKYTCY
ncbi:uncharacterized protein [Ranitomeya imitator]|uniref:uncharacterized protein n=1 Tax=Ranitomeya imitator TaxID=111125 RepID=UPI0037E92597